MNARVLACGLALAVTGCAGTARHEPATNGSATAQPFAWGYTCADGFRFSARVRDREATLDLGRSEVTLAHARSASGARYGSGETEYWSKGRKATLRTPRGTHRACRGQPAADPWEAAALRGASFRALGQEPGWALEIVPDHWIRLIHDYGTQRGFWPIPTPRLVGDDATIYRTRTDAHDLVLRILRQPCRDSMNGRSRPETVTVVLDGRELHGCGQRLPSH